MKHPKKGIYRPTEKVQSKTVKALNDGINTVIEKHLSEIVKLSGLDLINIPHWLHSLGMKMSNTRKHDNLVKTFSILDRMHQRLGIEIKAKDAYEVQVIEQLLETCGCVGTAAILARTSLEQVVADFMANQDEQELKYFLEELAGEARTKGLDPVTYVAQFAERELRAVKGYAKRLKNLVGRKALNSNEESRKILDCQMSEVIGDWKVFVKRARYMANTLVFE